MEIEYSLKPEDIQAFARYHRKLRSVRTEPSLGAITIIIVSISAVVIGVGLGMLLPLYLFRTEGFLAYWIGLSVGFFGGGLLLRWRQAWMNRSSLKALWEDPRSEWAVRDVRVVLSPNELRTVARGVTTMYEWSRVWHTGETDNHIFLCFSRNSAILIPRRAFRDNQQFEEFIALAHQYRQDRGQPTPKPTGIITSLPPQSDAFTRPDVP